MTPPLLTVPLPGTVVTWIYDRELHRASAHHTPGEAEWRAALDGCEHHRYGRGFRYTLRISPQAATELADELAERAVLEAGLPRADRVADPVLLEAVAQRIRAALTPEEK